MQLYQKWDHLWISSSAAATEMGYALYLPLRSLIIVLSLWGPQGFLIAEALKSNHYCPLHRRSWYWFRVFIAAWPICGGERLCITAAQITPLYQIKHRACNSILKELLVIFEDFVPCNSLWNNSASVSNPWQATSKHIRQFLALQHSNGSRPFKDVRQAVSVSVFIDKQRWVWLVMICRPLCSTVFIDLLNILRKSLDRTIFSYIL